MSQSLWIDISGKRQTFPVLANYLQQVVINQLISSSTLVIHEISTDIVLYANHRVNNTQNLCSGADNVMSGID